MRESGYYPPGAEYDPTAPYNQSEPEEQMYDVKASFTLTTIAAVSTENYDDVGMCDPKEYLEQHMTPLQLIEQCRRLAKEAMAHAETFRERSRLVRIISECDGWEQSYEEFEQND